MGFLGVEDLGAVKDRAKPERYVTPCFGFCGFTSCSGSCMFCRGAALSIRDPSLRQSSSHRYTLEAPKLRNPQTLKIRPKLSPKAQSLNPKPFQEPFGQVEGRGRGLLSSSAGMDIALWAARSFFAGLGPRGLQGSGFVGVYESGFAGVLGL